MKRAVLAVLVLTCLCWVGFWPSVGQGEQQNMNGLSMRLGEGSPEAPEAVVKKRVETTPLSDADAGRLLERLPAATEKEKDKQAFAWPPESPPAPRTGKTVEVPFPPEDTAGPAPKAETAPLEVLRRAPEGDVPIAPSFSLTFSQPMVPLTSIGELAAKDLPVSLTPMPAGKWRWVGTRTLVFDVDPRFPMATAYKAEVPAGTKSAVGGVLAQAVKWEFKTPAPTLVRGYPEDGPQRLQPLMFASFDQRIDPAAAIRKVRVRTNGQTFETALVGADELKEDQTVKGLAEGAEPGRWLAFKTVKPLPVGAKVEVLFDAGLPSAEGPLVTSKAQSFTFETYGPLRYREHGCGGWRTDCPPLRPWFVYFTNPLDAKAFDPSWVRVEPKVEGLKVNVSGNNLNLSGLTQGRTTYRVTLSPEIKDIFGQTLGTAGVLTFKIGSAPPVLSVPAGEFMVLDPAGKPALSIYSINHDRLNLRVFQVEPEKYPDYEKFLRQDMKILADPPGNMVDKRVLQIAGEPDKLVETSIDLAPYLKGKPGHLIVEIKPEAQEDKDLLPGRFRPQPRHYHTWVQSTAIAVDAVAGPERFIVWTNALKDGAPLDGVEVTLLPGGSRAVSGKDGLAEPAQPDGSQPEPTFLVAKKGEDSAVLRQNDAHGISSGWRKAPETDALRWFVFDDRQMYRPGETLKLKGWIRVIGGGTKGDVGPLPAKIKELDYVASDSRRNEFARGKVKINAWGGFDLSLNLPANLNLGQTAISLGISRDIVQLAGLSFRHEFQVQEFRRPEFEVSAKAGEGPFFVLDSAVVTTSARYYAGGVLPNADVTWEIRTQPGYYSPPGWEGFVFGTWRPWWRHYDASEKQAVKTYSGRTDAAGEHRLRLDFESVNPPEPTSISAEATVMDVNRQAWTAELPLLVHPADEYVGIKMDRPFVQAGEPFEMSLIVADLDGKAVSGRTIELKVIQEEWEVKDGQWRTIDQVRESTRVESGKEPKSWSYKPKAGGTYRIVADIKDAKGRANRTTLTRWVGGGQRPPDRRITQEDVMLIPDKPDYQPGMTAEILIQSPFFPAEGLVTLGRSGIVDSYRITLEGPTYTLKVPILEAYIPNIHVRVDLVGAATRTGADGRPDDKLPKRPAFGAGSINLSVPPLARTMTLSVEPKDKKLEPGGQTSVELKLSDASGKPVKNAEVALVVVDEAVLALTGYQMDDPVAVFYSLRADRVGTYRLRDKVILASLDDLKSALDKTMREMEDSMATMNKSMRMSEEGAPMPPPSPAPMMAAGAAPGAPAQAPIRMRLDFNALAHFAPEVRTDAEGRAVVPIKLPDNLTRYRIMAVAVADGKYFGQGESAVTARLPLMVRPSAPRFLNFGDKFELPVTIQNQTDNPMTVDVAVSASNAVLTAGSGRRVTVPANDRVEIRFPAKTDMAGKARFRFAAASGAAADAAEVELPVYTPATAEAFAVYGEIDEGTAIQPVQPPANVYPQFGGLTVTTSSTALQALTDAVLYLVSYPFECSEQLASRVLSIAALRDVLTAFEAEGLPPAKDIEAAVARDIDRLKGLQNYDGGFPIWERGRESWPYYSIHAAHALVRARAKGYKVPEDMHRRSMAYLKDIRNRIPSKYFESVKYALEAYALYVRNLAGDPDIKAAKALLKKPGLEKLTPEAVGWLYPIIIKDKDAAADAAAIKRYFNNRAVETAGAAGFITSYDDGGYLMLHSSRRTDAIVLEALIQVEPKNDLIVKIVRGLLAHRTRGHWGNTQENTFVLLALDAYFRKYESVTPDFVAKAWIGEKYAGQARFKGRTTDYQQITIPMEYLAGKPAMDLAVSKEGAGRMYYRLGLRYAPTDLNLKPADYGFVVTRTYQPIDDPGDVSRDATGAWRIKAGARVRVKLTLAADFRRYHVALIDPLPAGLEAVNPALAVSGTLPEEEDSREEKGWFWWLGPWYEHQNLRDDRAEAFQSLLWEGVYDYAYVARATTPGVFIAPPARAEEMYSPETFGRSGTDVVIVE